MEDSSSTPDNSGYLVTFETTATVSITLRVNASDQQQALADGFAYAAKADLPQFKVKSAHTDSLVNISVEKDFSDEFKPAGGFSVKWIDSAGVEFKQQDGLVYEDAKSLVEGILDGGILREVEAAVFEANTGRRIMSAKSPRGGFEVIATPINPTQSLEVKHTWIQSKPEATSIALALHRKKVYSKIQILDLSDREHEPVSVMVIE